MGWSKTPFETIEQAHATASKMRLYPSSISTKPGGNGTRFFTVREGKNKNVIVAQRGEGPVLEKITKVIKQEKKQKPEPKKEVFRKLQVGEWSSTFVSHYSSFEDVIEGLKKSMGIYFKDLSYEVVLLVRDAHHESEAEYRLGEDGVMQVRHLL